MIGYSVSLQHTPLLLHDATYCARLIVVMIAVASERMAAWLIVYYVKTAVDTKPGGNLHHQYCQGTILYKFVLRATKT